MNDDLSARQIALKTSLANRQLDSEWRDGDLEVGAGNGVVVIAFDHAPTLDGAAVVRRPEGDDTVARIAFFESLRIASPATAREFVTECHDAGLPSGAPEDWKETDD